MRLDIGICRSKPVILSECVRKLSVLKQHEIDVGKLVIGQPLFLTKVSRNLTKLFKTFNKY